MLAENTRRRLEEALGVEVASGVSLREHTSFRIGGPASLLIHARRAEEVSAALAEARRLGVSTLVVGGGTNLLVSDAGFDGLVILVETSGVSIHSEGRRITAGAGVAASAMVEEAIAAGLGGLEFAAGLPGTVGGAVAGNAGCFGGAFGEKIVSAKVVLADGRIACVDDPAFFAFDYRSSSLAQLGAIIVEATFAVAPADRARLEDDAAAHVGLRREKHPPKGARTAGSYFKNLPPESPGGMRRAAGALLDRVEAKSMRVGGAAVFERHANMIVNDGDASAADVLALAERMRRAVFDRFGVELQPEVRFVGERPEGA